MYRPSGFFRYDGRTEWVAGPIPKEGNRIEGMCVFNGHIYSTTFDGCGIFRYDGTGWSSLGQLEPTGQTYSFEVMAGQLYVGSWPNGRVYRHGGGSRWTSAGRLGNEKEVMGMTVYNGKLYAGTLPLATIFRYEGGTTWTDVGRLDFTPDVRYRRAHSVAVYKGRLYAGTLPSGHVHSIEAGKNATYDYQLAPGWRHLAAVRDGNRLKLYLDAELVATSSQFDPAEYDLSNDEPFKVGFGTHDYFNGLMSDLRIYNRVLGADEIFTLSTRSTK